MKRALAICLLAVAAGIVVAAEVTHTVSSSQKTVYGPVPNGGSRDLDLGIEVHPDEAATVTVEITICRDGHSPITAVISKANPYANSVTDVTEIKAEKTSAGSGGVKVIVDFSSYQAGEETTSTWRTTATEGATLFDREEASWIDFAVSVDPGQTATVQLLDGTTVIESWSVTEEDPLAMSGYGTTIEALADSGSGTITWATSAQ